MRVSCVVATAFLIAATACGRSSLLKPRSADTSSAGNGPDGSGGAVNGTGGRPQGSTAGASGSALGNGGAPGFGGATVTGGQVGTGGAGGTAGTNRAGGAGGAGGTPGTGGTRATGGSSGVGGRMGTGGFINTGGAPTTGGALGGGGVATHGGQLGNGGRVGAGGSSGGAIGAGGRAASGGAVSAGGTTTSGGATGSGGFCGNGMVDPGEQCDLGAGNQALPAFRVTQSSLSFAAVPLMRSDPGWKFYDYSSSSAHTGFEAVGASRILLYLDTSALALNLVFFHGIDKDATGQEQPSSIVVMNFSGLPNATNVCVADESDELLLTSPTTATALWNFTNNSDGGVLCTLPFPGDWEITIAPSFLKGISTWTWVQSDGSMLNLDLTQPLTIKAYNAPSSCRPNCTIPRCGDGILDGGEICDDGSQPMTDCVDGCQTFD